MRNDLTISHIKAMYEYVKRQIRINKRPRVFKKENALSICYDRKQWKVL